MPTFAQYNYGFWEWSPKLWQKCMNEAAQSMIDEGWKPYASKFDRVKKTRALKLWRQHVCRH